MNNGAYSTIKRTYGRIKKVLYIHGGCFKKDIYVFGTSHWRTLIILLPALSLHLNSIDVKP